jgi:TrmH family RNA methyltransferase
VISKPAADVATLATQKLVVVLENIRDPGNLGTMIRTADWFGASSVVCIAGADPWGEKVVRSSMGSVFHLSLLSFERATTAIQTLKAAGFTIMVTRPEVKSNLTKEPAQKLALVMGNESTGTSEEVDAAADLTYSIPQFGKAESLNVGVSLGITLHDLSKSAEFAQFFRRV